MEPDTRPFRQRDPGPGFSSCRRISLGRGHALFGKSTEQARVWARGLLHQLRHGQEEKVVQTLGALLTSTAGLAQETQTAVRAAIEYFQTHREHMHYSKVARQRGPIGSGSVESLCSQLQNRFKRTGQYWTPSGLRNLLTLEVFLRNNNLHLLWN